MWHVAETFDDITYAFDAIIEQEMVNQFAYNEVAPLCDQSSTWNLGMWT